MAFADDGYLIAPNPARPGLTRTLCGTDHSGAAIETAVIEERPLTIFLNGQEIVTAMTIGDYPEYLALGFLRNQGMLRPGEEVRGVDYDDGARDRGRPHRRRARATRTSWHARPAPAVARWARSSAT